MSTETRKNGMNDLSAAVANLLNAQMKMGTDLFESFTGLRVSQMTETLRRQMGDSKCGRHGCCDVPPPCWMPRRLCDCTSHVAECKTACVDLIVTNEDRVGRTITVAATGPDANLVTVTPAALNVGPYERARFTACLTVPQGTGQGKTFEVVLWVRGCRDHVMRWTVSVGTTGLGSCHEIEITDQPEWRHHWYDHFYCHRPCSSGRVGAAANG
jgi:hypothetical protein